MIKETTETASSTSFLDIYLKGHFSTRLYDKSDDFNFSIILFPNIGYWNEYITNSHVWS
jgi:hypothetical protein